jgi:hypothetical protein
MACAAIHKESEIKAGQIWIDISDNPFMPDTSYSKVLDVKGEYVKFLYFSKQDTLEMSMRKMFFLTQTLLTDTK